MGYPRRLAVAILVGSAVPVVPLTLLGLAVAGLYVSDALDRGESIRPSVDLVLLPSLVTVPIVAAATIVFGLPIHAILVRTRRASDLAYSLAGGLVGFALPLVLVAIDGSADGFALPALGLVSGAATGHAWWIGRTRDEA